MEKTHLIPISDLHQLALLDTLHVRPVKVEYSDRYWGFFESSEVEKYLADFESGKLMVSARAFVDGLRRTKDRVFENERRARSGYGHLPLKR